VLFIFHLFDEEVLPAQRAMHSDQGFWITPPIMGHHLLMAYSLTLQEPEIMEIKNISML
jgi:hypothetical protein